MKSRYSAFVANNSKYIIKTTHKENKEYTPDTKYWEDSIKEFCKNCEFKKLEIIEFIEQEIEAFVTFKASIFCHNKDNTFKEKSKFLKVDGKWLYHSGTFL